MVRQWPLYAPRLAQYAETACSGDMCVFTDASASRQMSSSWTELMGLTLSALMWSSMMETCYMHWLDTHHITLVVVALSRRQLLLIHADIWLTQAETVSWKLLKPLYDCTHVCRPHRYVLEGMLLVSNIYDCWSIWNCIIILCTVLLYYYPMFYLFSHLATISNKPIGLDWITIHPGMASHIQWIN